MIDSSDDDMPALVDQAAPANPLWFDTAIDLATAQRSDWRSRFIGSAMSMAEVKNSQLVELYPDPDDVHHVVAPSAAATPQPRHISADNLRQVIKYTKTAEELVVDVDMLERPSKDYECCICTHVMRNAVQCDNGNRGAALDSCRHVACATCMFKWVEKSGKCPTCRQPTTADDLIPHFLLRKRIAASKIKCGDCHVAMVLGDPPHFDYKTHLKECVQHERACIWLGCEWKGKDARRHETDCPRRPVSCEDCDHVVHFELLREHREQKCTRATVQCPSAECKWTGPRCEQAGHFRDECIFGEPTHCDWCKTTHNQFKKHRETCEMRPMTCDKCQERNIPLVNMQMHLALRCPEAFVPCALARHGCTLTGRRKTMKTHMAEAGERHADLLLAAMDKLVLSHEATLKKHRDDLDKSKQILFASRKTVKVNKKAAAATTAQQHVVVSVH